jgi:hypothetical protein
MVAIKDMEMPIRCAECKFCIRQKSNDYGSFGQCMVQNCETVNTLNWSLPPSCPLVEIGKVGKWLGERGYPICEKCGCNVYEKYISCSDYAEITTKMDYCPNCGAEMRGEDNV